MTTQTVTFCVPCKLPCTAPAEVTLCVDAALTASGKSSLDATIALVAPTQGNCGPYSCQYTFSYDDTELADPDTLLLSSQIDGVFCKDCLTSWVENSIQKSSPESLGYVTPQMFGAEGDSTHDDTDAIQAAVDYATANFKSVFFPPVATYYKTIAPILVSSSGLKLFGAGYMSVVVNTEPTDIFQIGDGTNQITDVVISGLNLQILATNPSRCLNVRRCPNILIENCLMGGGDASAVIIEMTNSWDARIMNNTFGTIQGTAMSLAAGANGLWICGNRIDGGAGVHICGISVNGVAVYIHGNVIENWDLGINLAGGGPYSICSYFETNKDYSIRSTGALAGLDIHGCYFADDVTAVAAIKLTTAFGVTVHSNYSSEPHTSGAFMQITVPYPDPDFNISQNVFTGDVDEVITVP